MRVLIIHNSIYGNGIIAANTLADKLSDQEVIISHNKDISPSEVISLNIDLLIIGTAVRRFVVSWESQKWLKLLNKLLNKNNDHIPFVVGFITHCRDIEKISKKSKKYFDLLRKMESFLHVYPILLYAQVIDIEGPFKHGVIENLRKEVSMIVNWIDNNLPLISQT